MNIKIKQKKKWKYRSIKYINQKLKHFVSTCIYLFISSFMYGFSSFQTFYLSLEHHWSVCHLHWCWDTETMFCKNIFQMWTPPSRRTLHRVCSGVSQTERQEGNGAMDVQRWLLLSLDMKLAGDFSKTVGATSTSTTSSVPGWRKSCVHVLGNKWRTLPAASFTKSFTNDPKSLVMTLSVTLIKSRLADYLSCNSVH